MMKHIVLFLGLLAMQTPPAQPTPLPEPKSATVPRIDAAIKIDGTLDEAPWEKAARLTPFVHHDTMAAARATTDARIWYDQAALYVGWIAGDAAIQARFTARDRRSWAQYGVDVVGTP